ncbi:hypothetical protein [Pseudomonas segetis]|nr:hypothetical protein [Pseudomonas segetis]
MIRRSRLFDRSPKWASFVWSVRLCSVFKGLPAMLELLNED